MTAAAEPPTPSGNLSIGPSDALIAELELIYKDIHAHPELSMQETRTAGIVADWLKASGCEVATGIGGTGVIGVLKNGEGPTVLLRADMDALPVTENTGLAYASQATGVDRFGQATGIAHVCGHDMHVAWLMGAARVLAENKGRWKGSAIALFQPAEETGQGADAMVKDQLAERIPKPDVVLAQHVVPAPAGAIAWRSGTAMALADSWEVKLFGRGAHGSAPQKSIDPVLMASSAVMRLQGVVSREVAMTDSAVVTVGTLQAGKNENVIPDEALLRLNVRTFKQEVRKRVLAAIRRILDAEAAASGAPKPPEISVLSEFPAVVNDEAPLRAVVAAFERRFGPDRVVEQTEPASASEDFSVFGPALGARSVYWFVGGTDATTFAAAEKAGTLDELPSNHAPNFAPVINPTLRTGVETLLDGCRRLAGNRKGAARSD